MNKKRLCVAVLILFAMVLGIYGLWKISREGKIVPAEDGSAYYFIDTNGDIVCDTPFQYVYWKKIGYVEFYKIENGTRQKKYGYIDSSFDLIKNKCWSTFADYEMVNIRDGYIVTIDRYPSSTLKILDYDLNVKTIIKDVQINSPYSFFSSDDIISVKAKNGLWGAVDIDGNWILEPKYDELSWFKDGYVGARIEDLWGVLDLSGNWVIPPQFYSQIFPNKAYFPVDVNENYWEACTIFININGKRLNDEMYYSLYTGHEFNEGLVNVAVGDRVNHLVGFINETGEEIIKPQYEEVFGFCNGCAAVSKIIDGKEKWAYIDKNGNNITDFIFDKAYAFSDDGYAKVKLNGKYGFIKRDGSWLLEPQFDDVTSFSYGYATVKLTKGQKIKK
ncbi:WG containing repeat-containing protein [Pseudobutyrivibrio sp. YE44]|uniref:WG repeat-containing protein n=1 Tax=Pseudobutyrivibrio sp. YE44 TaxID=1520802 RepID=UPI00088B7D83|nr:WG repeat-containing protein [Pseudobutyrivibrio sp. YE44]SDB40620.1 WG containing repeat-containing protein [Pseudobutyrivibrio sp. YE44]